MNTNFINKSLLTIVCGFVVVVIAVTSAYFRKSDRENVSEPEQENRFFSTADAMNREVVLKVPIIEQPEQYACNVTAAAIVLQYRGISVSPWDVYEGLPKQTIAQADGFWGNPQLGYVGNIYGEYGGDFTEGYGVHWEPLYHYIKQFREAEIKLDWNIRDLLSEVGTGSKFTLELPIIKPVEDVPAETVEEDMFVKLGLTR